MSKKRRFGLRLIAAILAGAFTFSEAAHAAPVLPSPGTVAASLARDPSVFEVPADYSRLREIHRGSNGLFLIHVQDAHSNLSGQENLAAALDAIMENYHVSLVLVEGGSRDDSLTVIKQVASPATWKRVAKSFLIEGKISGEEYLNLISDRPMKIMGIEDRALYLESVKAYAELAARREDILDYLKLITAALEKVKKRLYPQELLAYERERKVRRDRDGDESGHHEVLALVARAGLDLARYPALSALARVQTSENKIDFEAASLEQAALVEAVIAKGGAADLGEALKRSAAEKGKQVSQYTHFRSLLQAAERAGVNLKAYPNFEKYGATLEEFSAIDLDSIAEELSRAEDDAYAKLLTEDDQWLARGIDRYLGLLQTAYRIQMSTREFAFFKINEPDFASMRHLAFINRKLAENGYAEELVPYRTILETGKTALGAFYDSVEQRDFAFIRNAERIMKAEKQDTAVLISGGYHTPHLKHLLREKGYSYAVLTPVVTSATNQAKYERLLLSALPSGAPALEGERGSREDGVRVAAAAESDRFYNLLSQAVEITKTPQAEESAARIALQFKLGQTPTDAVNAELPPAAAPLDSGSRLADLLSQLNKMLYSMPYHSPTFDQARFMDLVNAVEQIEIQNGDKDPDDYFTVNYQGKDYPVHPYRTSVRGAHPTTQITVNLSGADGVATNTEWMVKLKGAVSEKLKAPRPEGQPVFLRINGRPGSGKTFFSSALERSGIPGLIRPDEVQVIHTDEHLVMSQNRPVLNVSDVQYRYNIRSPSVRLFVVEGLHSAQAFGQKKLAPNEDVLVFVVTTDEKLRWQRIVERVSDPTNKVGPPEYFLKSALVRGVLDRYERDQDETRADMVIDTSVGLPAKIDGTRLSSNTFILGAAAEARHFELLRKLGPLARAGAAFSDALLTIASMVVGSAMPFQGSVEVIATWLGLSAELDAFIRKAPGRLDALRKSRAALSETTASYTQSIVDYGPREPSPEPGFGTFGKEPLSLSPRTNFEQGRRPVTRPLKSGGRAFLASERNPIFVPDAYFTDKDTLATSHSYSCSVAYATLTAPDGTLTHMLSHQDPRTFSRHVLAALTVLYEKGLIVSADVTVMTYGSDEAVIRRELEVFQEQARRHVAESRSPQEAEAISFAGRVHKKAYGTAFTVTKTIEGGSETVRLHDWSFRVAPISDEATVIDWSRSRPRLIAERRLGTRLAPQVEKALAEWAVDGSGELTIAASDGEKFRFVYSSEDTEQRIEVFHGEDKIGFRHFELDGDRAWGRTSFEDSEIRIAGETYTSPKAIFVDEDVRAIYGGLGSSLQALTMRLAALRGARTYTAEEVEDVDFFLGAGFRVVGREQGKITMRASLGRAAEVPPVGIFRKKGSESIDELKNRIRTDLEARRSRTSGVKPFSDVESRVSGTRLSVEPHGAEGMATKEWKSRIVYLDRIRAIVNPDNAPKIGVYVNAAANVLDPFVAGNPDILVMNDEHEFGTGLTERSAEDAQTVRLLASRAVLGEAIINTFFGVMKGNLRELFIASLEKMAVLQGAPITDLEITSLGADAWEIRFSWRHPSEAAARPRTIYFLGSSSLESLGLDDLPPAVLDAVRSRGGVDLFFEKAPNYYHEFLQDDRNISLSDRLNPKDGMRGEREILSVNALKRALLKPNAYLVGDDEQDSRFRFFRFPFWSPLFPSSNGWLKKALPDEFRPAKLSFRTWFRLWLDQWGLETDWGNGRLEIFQRISGSPDARLSGTRLAIDPAVATQVADGIFGTRLSPAVLKLGESGPTVLTTLRGEDALTALSADGRFLVERDPVSGEAILVERPAETLWRYTRTTLEESLSVFRYHLADPIAELDRLRRLAGLGDLPIRVLEWGVGDATIFSHLQETVAFRGIENVEFIGFSNMFFERWATAPSSSTLILDIMQNLRRYLDDPVHLIYSLYGLLYLPQDEEGLRHLHDLYTVLNPLGGLITDTLPADTDQLREIGFEQFDIGPQSYILRKPTRRPGPGTRLAGRVVVAPFREYHARMRKITQDSVSPFADLRISLRAQFLQSSFRDTRRKALDTLKEQFRQDLVGTRLANEGIPASQAIGTRLAAQTVTPNVREDVSGPLVVALKGSDDSAFHELVNQAAKSELDYFVFVSTVAAVLQDQPELRGPLLERVNRLPSERSAVARSLGRAFAAPVQESTMRSPDGSIHFNLLNALDGSDAPGRARADRSDLGWRELASAVGWMLSESGDGALLRTLKDELVLPGLTAGDLGQARTMLFQEGIFQNVYFVTVPFGSGKTVSFTMLVGRDTREKSDVVADEFRALRQYRGDPRAAHVIASALAPYGRGLVRGYTSRFMNHFGEVTYNSLAKAKTLSRDPGLMHLNSNLPGRNGDFPASDTRSVISGVTALFGYFYDVAQTRMISDFHVDAGDANFDESKLPDPDREGRVLHTAGRQPFFSLIALRGYEYADPNRFVRHVLSLSLFNENPGEIVTSGEFGEAFRSGTLDGLRDGLVERYGASRALPLLRDWLTTYADTARRIAPAHPLFTVEAVEAYVRDVIELAMRERLATPVVIKPLVIDDGPLGDQYFNMAILNGEIAIARYVKQGEDTSKGHISGLVILNRDTLTQFSRGDVLREGSQTESYEDPRVTPYGLTYVSVKHKKLLDGSILSDWHSELAEFADVNTGELKPGAIRLGDPRVMSKNAFLAPLRDGRVVFFDRSETLVDGKKAVQQYIFANLEEALHPPPGYWEAHPVSEATVFRAPPEYAHVGFNLLLDVPGRDVKLAVLHYAQISRNAKKNYDTAAVVLLDGATLRPLGKGIPIIIHDSKTATFEGGKPIKGIIYALGAEIQGDTLRFYAGIDDESVGIMEQSLAEIIEGYEELNGDSSARLVGNGTRLSAQWSLAPGVEGYQYRHSTDASEVDVRVFEVSPSSVASEQLWDDKVRGRNLVEEPLSKEDPAGLLYDEYAKKSSNSERLLMIVPTLETGFLIPGGFLLVDGEVKARTAPSFLEASTGFAPLNGVFSVMGLDRDHIGVQEVSLKDGRVEGASPVPNGFSGALILKDGQSKVDEISFGQRDKINGPNFVSWPRDRRAALSAFGTKDGKLVNIQASKAPGSDKNEMTIDEFAALLKELGVKDAILSVASSEVGTLYRDASGQMVSGQALPHGKSRIHDAISRPDGQRPVQAVVGFMLGTRLTTGGQLERYPVIYYLDARLLNKPFSQISDEEIDAIVKTGASHVWVPGVYRKSEFSRQLNEYWSTREDYGGAKVGERRVASPFAIPAYEIADELGGEAAFRDFVRRARAKGLRVILDFVMNHTSADSPFLKARPDLFLEVPQEVAAREKEEHLRMTPENEMTPIFRHPENDRLFYYGGGLTLEKTTLRWADTAQIDITRAEARQFMISEALRVADLADGGGIRFDAVIHLMRHNFKEAWFPNMPQEEFDLRYPADEDLLQSVTKALKKKYPDILLIAEYFGLDGDDILDKGFDLFYEPYIRELLAKKDIVHLKQFLKSITPGQKFHFIKYLENHDLMDRITKLLGREASLAAGTLLYTLPGATLIFNGQERGYSQWVPTAVFVDGPPETTDQRIADHYERLARDAADDVFREGDFELLEDGVPTNGVVFERWHEGRSAVVSVNFSDEPITFTTASRDGTVVTASLGPWESRIDRLPKEGDPTESEALSREDSAVIAGTRLPSSAGPPLVAESRVVLRRVDALTKARSGRNPRVDSYRIREGAEVLRKALSEKREILTDDIRPLMGAVSMILTTWHLRPALRKQLIAIHGELNRLFRLSRPFGYERMDSPGEPSSDAKSGENAGTRLSEIAEGPIVTNPVSFTALQNAHLQTLVQGIDLAWTEDSIRHNVDPVLLEKLKAHSTDPLGVPLRYVFLELSKNALDAVDRAQRLAGTSAAGSVVLSARREGESIVVDVSDTGVGFAEVIDRPGEYSVVSGAGQSVLPAAHFGGSTVGLIWSKVLLDSYGGKLEFLKNAVPGYRTTARVTLPISAVHREVFVQGQPKPYRPPTTPPVGMVSNLGTRLAGEENPAYRFLSGVRLPSEWDWTALEEVFAKDPDLKLYFTQAILARIIERKPIAIRSQDKAGLFEREGNTVYLLDREGRRILQDGLPVRFVPTAEDLESAKESMRVGGRVREVAAAALGTPSVTVATLTDLLREREEFAAAVQAPLESYLVENPNDSALSIAKSMESFPQLDESAPETFDVYAAHYLVTLLEVSRMGLAKGVTFRLTGDAARVERMLASEAGRQLLEKGVLTRERPSSPDGTPVREVQLTTPAGIASLEEGQPYLPETALVPGEDVQFKAYVLLSIFAGRVDPENPPETFVGAYRGLLGAEGSKGLDSSILARFLRGEKGKNAVDAALFYALKPIRAIEWTQVIQLYRNIQRMVSQAA